MRLFSSVALAATLVGLVGVGCSSSTTVAGDAPADAGVEAAGGSGAGGSSTGGSSGSSTGGSSTGGAGGGGGTPATSCKKDTDCGAGQWCDTSAGSCAPLVADGDKCGADNQCNSTHCVGGVCCHTACASPMTCASGKCSCNGASCGTGATCVVWHLDEDGDGHAGKLADVVGCSDQTPVPPAQYAGHKYLQTADDCDDANPDAFPGQTKFFTKARADGTFDYNCDTKAEKKYSLLQSLWSCKSCFTAPPSDAGVVCLSPCLANGRINGYQCNGASYCGAPTIWQGLFTNVGCGQSGTLHTCNPCATGETTSAVTQACH